MNYFAQTGVASTPEEFAAELRREARLPESLVKRMSMYFRRIPSSRVLGRTAFKVERQWALRTLRANGWKSRWIAETFGLSPARVHQITKRVMVKPTNSVCPPLRPGNPRSELRPARASGDRSMSIGVQSVHVGPMTEAEELEAQLEAMMSFIGMDGYRPPVTDPPHLQNIIDAARPCITYTIDDNDGKRTGIWAYAERHRPTRAEIEAYLLHGRRGLSDFKDWPINGDPIPFP